MNFYPLKRHRINTLGLHRRPAALSATPPQKPNPLIPCPRGLLSGFVGILLLVSHLSIIDPLFLAKLFQYSLTQFGH
jgi:hypothetical protein